MKPRKVQKFLAHTGVQLLGAVKTGVSVGRDGVEEITEEPNGLFIVQRHQGQLLETKISNANLIQTWYLPEEPKAPAKK